MCRLAHVLLGAALVAGPAGAAEKGLKTGEAAETRLGGDGADWAPAGKRAVFDDLSVSPRISFGAQITQDALGPDPHLAERYGAVRSPFGDFVFGAFDNALSQTAGSLAVQGRFRPHAADLYRTPADQILRRGAYDDFGLRYDSGEAFDSMSLSLSWRPDIDADGETTSLRAHGAPTLASRSDGPEFSAGANYNLNLGSVGVAFGGGYLTNEIEDLYHAGIELNYGGAALAGFIDRTIEDSGDFDALGVGASYNAGGWTLGGGVYLTNDKAGGDDAYASAGVTYNVAPGVTASGSLEWGEDAQKDDAFGAQATIKLRF